MQLRLQRLSTSSVAQQRTPCGVHTLRSATAASAAPPFASASAGACAQSCDVPRIFAQALPTAVTPPGGVLWSRRASVDIQRRPVFPEANAAAETAVASWAALHCLSVGFSRRRAFARFAAFATRFPRKTVCDPRSLRCASGGGSCDCCSFEAFCKRRSDRSGCDDAAARRRLEEGRGRRRGMCAAGERRHRNANAETAAYPARRSLVPCARPRGRGQAAL